MLLYSAYGLTSSLLCFNSIQMKHTLGYVKKTGISPPVPHICIYFYVHSLNTVHTWSVVNLTLTKLFSFIFPMLYSRWFLFGCQFLALSTRSFSSTFAAFVHTRCDDFSRILSSASLLAHKSDFFHIFLSNAYPSIPLVWVSFDIRIFMTWILLCFSWLISVIISKYSQFFYLKNISAQYIKITSMPFSPNLVSVHSRSHDAETFGKLRRTARHLPWLDVDLTSVCIFCSMRTKKKRRNSSENLHCIRSLEKRQAINLHYNFEVWDS